MKKKCFLRIPPDTDCLHQHFICANYSTYLVLHSLLKKHPSPIGHGWEQCHPLGILVLLFQHIFLHYARKKVTDEEQEEGREEDSELSEEEWSDLN